MNRNVILIAATVFTVFLFSVNDGHALQSIGNSVDSYCAPRGVTPFGGNCDLCHANSTNKSQAMNGNYDWFCPAPTVPTCTDADKDGYSVEGGSCGPVDCNDSNPKINPAAAENCTDGIDNNCNGLIDTQDSGAVGCPPVCTDKDHDGYAIEGGACGPVDCNDANPLVNPGEAEVCGDGRDNDCNGAIDENCGPICTDKDSDGFSVEGGDCGPIDCNDGNALINPDATDICGDGVDNNCNGTIDENCAPVLTCTDEDGDGFSVEGGNCGKVDCDDTNALVFPGASENCTDGVDNNCNGLIDTQDTAVCKQAAVCTDSDGDTYAVEGGDCGPVDCDDNDAYNNPGAVEFCGDGVDNDCDGLIDEGCDTACPDADGDSYLDAACGGNDCNDNDPAINPGAEEIIGNGIDENCNGMSDDVCTTCPSENPGGSPVVSGDDEDKVGSDSDRGDDRHEREYRHETSSDSDVRHFSSDREYKSSEHKKSYERRDGDESNRGYERD